MLNDNKWVRTNYGDSILYTADNKEIAKIISYGDGYYKLILWLDNRHLDFVLELDSMEIAEWQAGLIIYKECNSIANRMHYIRDHLPSSHEMYDKAYPEESCNGCEYYDAEEDYCKALSCNPFNCDEPLPCEIEE